MWVETHTFLKMYSAMQVEIIYWWKTRYLIKQAHIKVKQRTTTHSGNALCEHLFSDKITAHTKYTP